MVTAIKSIMVTAVDLGHQKNITVGGVDIWHHKEHYSDCCRSVAPYRAYIGTVVDLCTIKSIIVTAVDL